jgi:hypothetical protein
MFALDNKNLPQSRKIPTMGFLASRRRLVVILVLAGLHCLAVRCFAKPAKPVEPPVPSWAVAVPGFVPPAAGEHPRLLFRKTDIPALQKKAETPTEKQSSPA